MSTLIRPISQRLAEGLLARIEGGQCVLVASVDGLCLARAGQSPVDGDRLAAIVSSLAALGVTAAREAGAGDLQCLVVEGAAGRLVARAMCIEGHPVLVAVQSDARATLGMVRVRLNELDGLLSPFGGPA